jgi:hypothetical protein
VVLLDRPRHPDARLKDETGRPLVNPPGEGGRLGLDYPTYLGLERLLSAQAPASSVPDERIFVITHQLSELVFKQMTFDLGVLAATFQRLLEAGAEIPLEAVARKDAGWGPALTASARLRHSARVVLPAVMQYLGVGQDNEALFSTEAFHHFRDFLVPSSGFQTAQLRLIQRALAKGPLLDVRVFPGDTYGEHYAGCPVGHVALADPLILHGHAEVAAPSEEAPTYTLAALDDLAHEVLARLPEGGGPPPPSVRLIHDAEVERAAARFRTTLGAETPDAEGATETFREDLRRAAHAENARREGLGRARRGAATLLREAPDGPLGLVLDRLAATDYALHGPHEEGFLTVHRKMARRHIHDDSGTGGGGMPYLVTSQRYLLPLFPALVAYLDLEEPG